MRISELFIMLFVITMFTTGFIGFYGALLNANGLSSQNFTYVNNTGINSSTVLALEKIYNETNQAQNNTGFGGGSNIVTFAPLNLLIGAFNAVMQAFSLPAVFYSLITDLTVGITGFPTWVASGLSMIILIIVISAVIYLIIGRPF